MYPDYYSSFRESLSICNDAVFKAVFTKDTPESRTALRSLLSAFLERELSILEVMPNEPAINDFRDRLIRFDFAVKFNDGELANVEMTINPKNDETLRFEYYTARLFVIQNIRGQDKSFSDLKPTYHLSFLGKNIYPDTEWLHRFTYYDSESRIKMGGRTMIMTVELKKLEQAKKSELAERLDNRESWGLFMMHYGNENNAELIQKLTEKNEGIAAAAQVMSMFRKTELEGLWPIKRDM